MATKRQPTEEQKTRAAERRQQFRAYCQTLAQMTDEQRAQWAQRAPALKANGQPYSLGNQILIALQRDGATVLCGFNQWKQAGRCVRKGEHGVMIWIPTGKKEDADPTPADPNAGSEDKPGFIMGTVFDIAQTEPLAEA